MSARGCAGSILDAPAQVLVCPTNTVGVMGAGLARAFAERHRGLAGAYRAACRSGLHRPDAPFAWTHPGGAVLCVATKRHWRDPSDIADVRVAAAAMFAWIADHEPASVAIPALGCGLGGLSWERQVRPLIEAGAAECRAQLLIYAPWGPGRAGDA